MALQCVNCDSDATFTVDNPGANPLDYCGRCIPARLRDLAANGRYPLRKEEPAPSKKKS